MGYILSFSSEFRTITLDEPRIRIIDNKDVNNGEINIVVSESAHSSRVDIPERY